MNLAFLFILALLGVFLIWLLVSVLRSGRTRQNSAPTIQNPPPPPPKPEPAPELSCFVKGIIRSMETEPEKWKADEDGSIGFRHEETKIHIQCGWASKTIHLSDSADKNLLAHEHAALRAALATLIDFPHKAVREKARAYFEPIGCPQEKTEGSG